MIQVIRKIGTIRTLPLKYSFHNIFTEPLKDSPDNTEPQNNTEQQDNNVSKDQIETEEKEYQYWRYSHGDEL